MPGLFTALSIDPSVKMKTAKSYLANKDSLDEKPKLVVLDESSMIGEWDEERLLSHRIPVLEIGDFGQVPSCAASRSSTRTVVIPS